MADQTQRDRNDEGKFESDVDENDVLEAMDPKKKYKSSEVGDLVGIPRRSAYEYLSRLEERGKVRSEKPESRRLEWELVVPTADVLFVTKHEVPVHDLDPDMDRDELISELEARAPAEGVPQSIYTDPEKPNGGLDEFRDRIRAAQDE